MKLGESWEELQVHTVFSPLSRQRQGVQPSEQRHRPRKLVEVSEMVLDVTNPHRNTEPHTESSEQKMRSLSQIFSAFSNYEKRTVRSPVFKVNFASCN